MKAPGRQFGSDTCLGHYAKPSRNPAFTLVELLVVIAVIAILAALLFPVLSRARLAADNTACRNNLRQLMVAVNLYVQQCSQYPIFNDLVTDLRPFVGADWPAENYDWRPGQSGGPIYLSSRTSVYACPAYNRLRGEFRSDPTHFPYDNTGSYGYNGMGTGGGGLGRIYFPPGQQIPPVRETQVVCPDDMIGMADSVIWGGGNYQTLFGVTGYWELAGDSSYDRAVLYGVPSFPDAWVTPDAARAMRQRHNWHWNVGFCDAHTENLLTRQLFDFGNPLVARRWNRDHQPHNEWWPLPP